MIALALLQIPIVIRTTENMLRLVPDSLREAAYALGTPKWKMISKDYPESLGLRIITGCCWRLPVLPGNGAASSLPSLSNQFWEYGSDAADC